MSYHFCMSDIKQSFTILYDQHITKIYRFIYLKVDSSETAEDLCSDVFIRVWKGFSNIESKQIENPQAFIYQIARNVIADHYREKSKTKIVAIEEIAESTNSAEEEVIVSLEMDQIRKTLLKLNEDYQNYVIWRYLDELSISEISQIVGKSQDSVRVGIHRALQALRRELEKQG